MNPLLSTNRITTAKTLIIILVSYALLLFMDYTNNHEHTTTICIFKNITGIPGAGCGLGRATLKLMHTDIYGSLQYHILAIPISITIIASFIWLTIDLFKGHNSYFTSINRKINLIYLIPIYMITAVSWIINIIRGI